MEVLADRVKWLREEKRLGQKEVASNIGVTLSGYQKIEYDQANPKLETLIKLVQYFNITADFLLGLSDETDLIAKIHQQLLKLKERLVENRVYQDQIRKELYEMQHELELMEMIMKNKDPIDKDEFKKIQRQLQMYKQQLAYHDQKYYEVKMSFDQSITDFFIKFYGIPHSKPEENSIIKEYLPLNIVLDEFSEGNFKITLKSLNGTNLGLLSWIQGEDKDSNYNEATKRLEEYKSLFRLN
jgi:transcriptional regulator with XRE-family HTH domain